MGAVNKTFVSNLLLLIGINLLIKPVYVLIIEAQVQERIGPENFGVYFALLNLSFILNILPDLGITNWNNRRIAQRGTILRSEIRSILLIRFALAAIYILTCVAAAFAMNYHDNNLEIILMLAFNQVLATGVLFFRSYLSGMHQFQADRIVSVSDRILLIAILGGMLFTIGKDQTFKVEYLIYGQTVAYGLSLLLAFYFVWRSSVPDSSHHHIQGTSILISSAPFASLILISMMSNRIDAILLERLTDSFQAGVYAMTFRLSDMLTMISFLFAVMLLPLFSRLLAQQLSTTDLFGTAFRMLVTGCVWVVSLCVLAPSWILEIIYDHHIKEAATVLPWTMVSAALFSLQYTTGTLLTADGRMKPLIVIASFALVGNILLNLSLIPENMAVGVAQAACITQAFIFIAQAFIVHKKYRVWTKSVTLQSALFMALATITIVAIKSFILQPLSAVLVVTLVIFTTAVALRMIPLREMLKNISASTIDNRE